MVFYRNLMISIFTAGVLLSCGSPEPATKIELSPLFSDHMVLQQNIYLPIWGNANPGGQVMVELMNQKIITVANQSGEWRAILLPVQTGGPFEMKVYGKDTIIIHDILVGEVWIGSGQSNMEMPLAGWGKIMNENAERAPS